MKASEFDIAFDEGKSVSEQIDTTQMRRPSLDHRRVQLSLPVWMIKGLDREASRLGVTRQLMIKMWLAERLERQAQ